MTRLLLAAVAALALTTPAAADFSKGMQVHAYTLDAKGKCHSPDGKFAAASKCKPATKHCRDPKTGKFAKCGTAGAVPA